jgi:hypothetical protein
MVWISLAFMIWWDYPNLLTLSSLAYKRRGSLMDKVGLDEIIFLGLACIGLSFGDC